MICSQPRRLEMFMALLIADSSIKWNFKSIFLCLTFSPPFPWVMIRNYFQALLCASSFQSSRAFIAQLNSSNCSLHIHVNRSKSLSFRPFARITSSHCIHSFDQPYLWSFVRRWKVVSIKAISQQTPSLVSSSPMKAKKPATKFRIHVRSKLLKLCIEFKLVFVF